MKSESARERIAAWRCLVVLIRCALHEHARWLWRATLRPTFRQLSSGHSEKGHGPKPIQRFTDPYPRLTMKYLVCVFEELSPFFLELLYA